MRISDWSSDVCSSDLKLLTHSSLRAKALWILGTTMGLFTLTSGAFLLNQQQVREARGWTDHTTEVRALTDELQMQVMRQESNLRGFVATHRQEFLPPY